MKLRETGIETTIELEFCHALLEHEHLLTALKIAAKQWVSQLAMLEAEVTRLRERVLTLEQDRAET